MKAIVTSIGEVTQNLCVWSLERNGFEVLLYKDGSSLAQKLRQIYNDVDEDFVRVDADVVPNNAITPSQIEDIYLMENPHAWWLQFKTFGWFSQNLIHGGVQFIRREALPILRQHVDEHLRAIRPETELSRVAEFYNPRRFMTIDECMGIHGFAARDINRVKQIKRLRNQYDTYDWELAEKLQELAR